MPMNGEIKFDLETHVQIVTAEIVETRVVSSALMRGMKTTAQPPAPGSLIKTFIPGQQPGPGLFRKAGNFFKAAVHHVAHGRPTTTLEVIQERFAICAGCNSFMEVTENDGRCMELKCGCNLSRTRLAANKLAWADQECPLKKWGAVDG